MWAVDGRVQRRQFKTVCTVLLIAEVLNLCQEFRALDGVWENV